MMTRKELIKQMSDIMILTMQCGGGRLKQAEAGFKYLESIGVISDEQTNSI